MLTSKEVLTQLMGENKYAPVFSFDKKEKE